MAVPCGAAIFFIIKKPTVMKPSNNLFALVRAYDTVTPPAHDKDEMILQSQSFLMMMEPYAKAITPLFENYTKKSPAVQNRFDAVMSIASDIGLDFLFATDLPDAVRRQAGKSDIRAAIHSIPEFCGMMRPELQEQMKLYGIRQSTRRSVEFDLFYGLTLFTFGRTKIEGEIVYAPYVLHPFFRFMQQTSSKV